MKPHPPCPPTFANAIRLAAALLTPLLLASGAPEENANRDQWWQAKFQARAADLPFSFTLDGKPSAEVLKTWKLERSERKLDENRTELVLTCTDPAGALSVRCVAVRYSDFPAIEWTPYFKNTGKTATPIIADIRALDARFERTTPGEFVLDHAKGSPAEASSFEPRTTVLGKKERKFQLATFGGRSSNSTMPYWKLTWGNEGVVTAVGWPGQWAADFESHWRQVTARPRGAGDDAFQTRAG